jgi:A/G-specific adenine glycosylase
MESGQKHEFQKMVGDFYRQYGRDLPWRPPSLKLRKDTTLDAYAILVSEVMLQQTQVTRVIPKYQEFLRLFPDITALASAPLADVLKVWSGLGYNRRAKYLHDAAKQLSGQSVWTLQTLQSCKGMGPNTAAAVMAYAYNQPIAFIETNIRTVFIHHFFSTTSAPGLARDNIADGELLPLVEQSLDVNNPREWYWALMDYGAYLKSKAGNASRRSKHYTKQPPFEGSRRQIRGQVLRLLARHNERFEQLHAIVPDGRLSSVLEELCAEGLVSQAHGRYLLTS